MGADTLDNFEELYTPALDAADAVVLMPPLPDVDRIIVQASAVELRQDDLEDLRRALPATFDGLEVQVIALDESDDGGDRVDVIRPGCSISSRLSTNGTIAAIVKHEGQPALLSNWHILRRSRLKRRGRYDIFQPGRIIGTRALRNVVAQIVRVDRGMDCGLALLNNSRPYETNTRITGFELREVRNPKEGDILEKVGARTDVTRGVVTEVRGIHVKLEPLPDSATEISKGGDSGALWYFPGTGAGAVLHTYGEKKGEDYASGRMLSAVQEALGFELF